MLYLNLLKINLGYKYSFKFWLYVFSLHQVPPPEKLNRPAIPSNRPKGQSNVSWAWSVQPFYLLETTVTFHRCKFSSTEGGEEELKKSLIKL